MTEAQLLTGVNQWLGVGIAVVGTVVVSPDGARLLWESFAQTLRHQGARLRGVLAKLLGRQRKDLRLAAGGAATAMAGNVANLMIIRGWEPDAPVDVRIDRLRQSISDVERQVGVLTQRLTEEIKHREEALGGVRADLEEGTGELRRRLEERDRRVAQVDARGLPVIGLGILLSGVPQQLAGAPAHLGWAGPAIGIALAAVAVAPWVGRVRNRFRERDGAGPSDSL
jgi:hypothetical protein